MSESSSLERLDLDELRYREGLTMTHVQKEYSF
jgi:hypothetical protein